MNGRELKPRDLQSRDRLALGRPRDPAIDQSILKVALDLFLEQGAEGVSFEQVSKRAGIPRATVYRRWKTRGELLNATLQSARTASIRDPNVVLSMAPEEFFRFLEDTIVSGLMSPIVPKLVTQLIGGLSRYPELLATYCGSTLEPGWRAMFKAIDKAHAESAIEVPLDRDVLRHLLVGAIVYRLISRSQRPREKTERAWTRRLMRQIGLSPAAK